MGTILGTGAEHMTERGATAEGGPVHVDVTGTEITDGDVRLLLSGRTSEAWERTFLAEILAEDFVERIPNGWKHHRARGPSLYGFSMFSDTLYVRDAPPDAASFRQLMLAVRGAMARTNAAEPSDDPPKADRSLKPVLEEVFAVRSAV